MTVFRTCTADDCEQAVKARGLCARHYARFRRSDPARDVCAIEDCEGRAVAFGFCPKHYARWRRTGSPAIVREQVSHGHCRGGSKSSTRHSWEAMLASCYRPSSKGYEYVGGRGIGVCERWRGPGGFERFLADMRERPRGRVLGRVDLNGDYTPVNCRWATRKEQQAARRPNARGPVADPEVSRV